MWEMTLDLTWQNQSRQGREGEREKKEGSPVQNNLGFQPTALHKLSIFIDSLNSFIRVFFTLFQNVLSTVMLFSNELKEALCSEATRMGYKHMTGDTKAALFECMFALAGIRKPTCT